VKRLLLQLDIPRAGTEHHAVLDPSQNIRSGEFKPSAAEDVRATIPVLPAFRFEHSHRLMLGRPDIDTVERSSCAA
jgi:hypothetical protein